MREGTTSDSLLDRSGNGRDRSQKGGHRRSLSAGEPLPRQSSIESLGESSTTPRNSKVALGHSLLTEARRFIKKKPAPIKRRWEIIRDSLVGPEGTSLLSRLSGRYGNIKDLLHDDMAEGEEGRMASGDGRGYGTLEDGVEIKRRDSRGRNDVMHSSVNEGVKGNGMSPGEKKHKKPFLCR
ncbi:hypothetical protein VYU27_009471, partial [Nannochloropsis oceanica]